MNNIKDLQCLLHIHTDFSNLDAVSLPSEYINYCADRGIPYCGITDHGEISGIHTLFETASKTGIRGIVGIEAYVDISEDFDRQTYGHLTMAAYTPKGIQNLYKLYNASWDHLSKARWGRKKPMMQWADLERYKEGVFVGSGCLGGVAAKAVMKKRPDIAIKNLNKLIDIYGKDLVYAEFMPGKADKYFNTKTQMVQVNEEVSIQIGDECVADSDYVKLYQLWLWENAVKGLGLKPVVTTDSHFVKKEDKVVQDLVLKSSEGGWHFTESTHVYSKEEIYQELSYLPGHGPVLHDSMIMNGLNLCSQITYVDLGIDKTPKLIHYSEQQMLDALNINLRQDRVKELSYENR